MALATSISGVLHRTTPIFSLTFHPLLSYSFLDAVKHNFYLLEQEDKEPVFDSVKTIMGMLEVSAEFAENITFNEGRIRSALPAGHLDATTLADYLVKKVHISCYKPCILL